MTEFAGIYLERDKAYISIIKTNGVSPIERNFDIFSTSKKTIFIKNIENSLPYNDFLYFVEIIVENTKNLKGIGVCSFGPFRSLSKQERRKNLPFGENLYGRTEYERKNRINDPFRNFDFYNTIKAALREIGHTDNVPIAVHTDAMAGAIAEAHIRSQEGLTTDDDNILLFLFLKEGIGGAFTFNGAPYDAKTHSEMGNIQVKLHPKDKDANVFEEYGLKHSDVQNMEGEPYIGPNHFFGNVGIIAGMGSIRKRHIKSKSAKNLKDYMKGDFCNLLSYYFALICLNSTAIFPPSIIIIGGDVTREIVENIRDSFGKLCEECPGMAFPKDRKNYIKQSRIITDCSIVDDLDIITDGKIESQYLGPAFLGGYAGKWDEYQSLGQ